MVSAIQDNTEPHCEERTEHGKENHRDGPWQMKVRYLRNREHFSRYAEVQGDMRSDERSKEAGNQRGIIHDADRNHLHGENGRRKRRSEDGRKTSRHTAHNCDMLVFLIHAEELRQRLTETASHHERRSLSAHRGTDQMREYGREENERRGLHRDVLSLGNRIDDGIGSSVFLLVQTLL